jgi:hypothetical protein
MIGNAIELLALPRLPLALSRLLYVSLTYILSTMLAIGFESQCSIAYKMISSTAFPKVTFIREPIVSPISLATLSVA